MAGGDNDNEGSGRKSNGRREIKDLRECYFFKKKTLASNIFMFNAWNPPLFTGG